MPLPKHNMDTLVTCTHGPNLKGKAGGFNLLLASHKYEDVPFGVTQMDSNGLLYSSLHIVLLRRLAEESFHRKCPSRDLENWYAAEEV